MTQSKAKIRVSQKTKKLNEQYKPTDSTRYCSMVGCHEIVEVSLEGPSLETHYYCQKHFKEVMNHSPV
jgi:hypothetical protein